MDPEALARVLRAEAEPLLAARPRAARPALVVMAGVPLSGKTTLALALAVHATTATHVVENDEVRARVARADGRDAPAYDRRENFLTYRTAWELCGLLLDDGVNAVHDATNLDESSRRHDYAVADARGAPAVVVLVETDETERAARAAAAPPERQEADRKLGRKRPNRAAIARPLVVLDGARPVPENLARLEAVPELAPLFAPGAERRKHRA